MKKLLKLSITLLLASSLFACGANTTQSNTSTDATSNETTSTVDNNEATETEMTIIHSKGEATVKLNPKKVVVFDMGTLDTMSALDIDVDVALPVSSVPSYITGYEDATNAGGIKEPDLEAIYTFAPDVIFISGRQADFYDQLNEIAPTVYIDLHADHYMEDFMNNVLTIGTLFEKEDLAFEKYMEIENKIKEAREKITNSDENALVILTNSGKISAYGAGSRFSIIHDVLGYKEADENLYADGEQITTHGKEVSFEYISKINPDILFVVDRDAAVGGENDATSTLNNDLVNSTNAAKNGKIVMLDPEVWYLSGGGLTSVNTMIDEAISPMK